MLIFKSLPVDPSPQLTTQKLIVVVLIGLALTLTAFFLGKTANRAAFLIVTAVLVVSQLVIGISTTENDLNLPTVDVRYPVPFLMFTGKPLAANQNALGYVGDMPPADKGSEYRILMIGASTVKNGGDNSLPNLLQKNLRSAGSANTTVYNWGVTSQNSGQELATLVFRAVDYHPDLVVMYDGAEMLYPITYDPRPGYPFNFLVFEQGNNLLLDADWGTMASLVLLKSNLVSSWFRDELQGSQSVSLSALRQQAGFQTPEWEKQITDSYLQNVDRACHVAKGYGFRLVVFLQPLIFFKSPLAGVETTIFDSNKDINDYMHREYQNIREGFKTLQAQNQDGSCYFVDESNVFNNYPDVAFGDDDVHPGVAATGAIAQQLSTELKRLNVVPSQ